MKHKISFTRIAALISIVVLVFNISCINKTKVNETSKAFSKAVNYYNITDINNWELNNLLISKNQMFPESKLSYTYGEYYYQKIDMDTISWLVFGYLYSREDTIFEPIDYYKHYEEDSYYQHVILFGENSDTLFHYRASMFGRMKKVFYKGNNYYKYKFGGLDSNERKAFIKFKDSLI